MSTYGRSPDRSASVLGIVIVCVSALGALTLTSCSSDTDIIGHCTAVTEPGLFLSGDNGGGYTWWSPSVGLLDDHLWGTYVQVVDGKWMGLGRWYDAATLAPTSEPVHLGTVDIWQLQNWVHDGDALVGQVWADPAEPATVVPEDEDQLVHLWRVTPPPASVSEGQRIVVTTAGPWDPFWPGTWFRAIGLSATYRAGFQGAVPIATTLARPIGALGVVAPCAATAGGEVSVHVFTTDLTAHRLPFPTTACGVGSASTPWLFPIDGDEVGLLYRDATVDDHEIRYVRLSSDGIPRSTTRVVGGGANVAVTDDTAGFQPRGVRVGGHILFTERRGANSECYTIRVMDLNGNDADDAPWQLPCANDGGYGDGPVVTWIHQLLSVPGAAVIVWYERTNVSSGVITNPASYHEGVFAVMLTEEGKRGSAVMRLTTSDFTAAQVDADGTPVSANDTDVQAIADGNNIFATWIDRRSPDAPAPAAGYQARMIRCTVDP